MAMFGFLCRSTQLTKEFGVNTLRGKRLPLLADSGILTQVDEGLAMGLT